MKKLYIFIDIIVELTLKKYVLLCLEEDFLYSRVFLIYFNLNFYKIIDGFEK